MGEMGTHSSFDGAGCVDIPEDLISENSDIRQYVLRDNSGFDLLLRIQKARVSNEGFL